MAWSLASRGLGGWLTIRLQVVRGPGFRTRCQPSGSRRGVARKRRERRNSRTGIRHADHGPLPPTKEKAMAVMIGVDPHKGSHTAVVVGEAEQSLGELRVRSGPSQVDRLLAWAEAFPERTWAMENATGLGYLLAH